jgi:hypothetical protein
MLALTPQVHFPALTCPQLPFSTLSSAKEYTIVFCIGLFHKINGMRALFHPHVCARLAEISLHIFKKRERHGTILYCYMIK